MKIHVSKIDAAVRQLNTAITLWFEDGDLVSIHTLASASHQIVYDIVKKKDGPELIFDSLVFKDEYRSEANRLLRAPQNFFKHADDDPEAVLEFFTGMPELFIMMTLAGLEFLKVPDDDVRSCFSHWFAIQHPDILTEKGKRQYVDRLPSDAKTFLASSKKLDFFHVYRMAHAKGKKSNETP